MKVTARIIGLLLTLCIPTLAANVSSTFDVDDDGWRVGEFFSTAGASVPSYMAAGGNPGGFIRTGDLFGWNAYHAPAKFLGDQSSNYGGTLMFDMQIASSDNINYPAVVLSDGVTLLQFISAIPGTSWTVFSIPLLASAGWQIASGSGNPGPAATEAQLQTVLGALTLLGLEADWQTGGDQVDLDNVKLLGKDTGAGGVPEPTTLAMLSGGLAVLAVLRRRQASR